MRVDGPQCRDGIRYFFPSLSVSLVNVHGHSLARAALAELNSSSLRQGNINETGTRRDSTDAGLCQLQLIAVHLYFRWAHNKPGPGYRVCPVPPTASVWQAPGDDHSFCLSLSPLGGNFFGSGSAQSASVFILAHNIHG